MEYYFSHLDPVTFQRLINAILVARFGENLRLTPIRGADGGRDGETAPGNPYFRFELTTTPPKKGIDAPVEKGRYLFQVKHHRTIDTRLIDARNSVVSDFRSELKTNVLNHTGDERVNYFYLITNVPASRDAISLVDQARRELLTSEPNLHADVWWSERLTAFLDRMPSLWPTFPELFAGKKVPMLPEVMGGRVDGLPRVIHMAIDRQYKRDSLIKFRQIELENSLSRLFIDLDMSLEHLPIEEMRELMLEQRVRKQYVADGTEQLVYYDDVWHRHNRLASAVGVLLNEASAASRRIILEGGPGQGKSTITQMVAQIYRDIVLGQNKLEPEGRWHLPKKVRLPLRVELRDFAEWLSKNPDGSVEQNLADVIKKETGGNTLSVDQIHSLVENSPVLLVFDGLDEVGSEDSRDEVLKRIIECMDRFENNLHTDLRVILTTRPPAIAGRREQLPEFRRFTIAPLVQARVTDFVKRWVAFQLQDTSERQWVRNSFEKRQNETHVKALATNPMQLSVLLHFIRLKGEAFPDRRVELYREYFKTVIDRDVEKSVELRQNRDTVDVLHQLIGYKIHSLTEAKKADGTLGRKQVLEIVEDWIVGQGSDPKRAHELFRIGEERLGLIVALKGEGEDVVYGFEIQPIREYFAAAFISDQIQGDAHAVFHGLLRRTYWKEVALFLAGLRRANEKADLVSRCKTIDQETVLGWRQDGRAMTLQLLQEGVFSQPPHVYSEALDFVIDLLDPAAVQVQNQPKGLSTALPPLINQGDASRHIDRVSGLISKFSKSIDEYTISRLYSVASGLLTDDQLIKEILKYTGNSPAITANVRLRWPCIWGRDVRKLSRANNYWDDVPDEVWAETLWGAFLEGNHGAFLSTPNRFHALLVEQFAVNPLPIATSRKAVNMPSASDDLGIWKLLKAQKTLFDVSLSPQPNQNYAASLDSDDDINLSGLDESTGRLVASLTRLTNKLISSLKGPGPGRKEALSSYLIGMRGYLAEPSMEGWIACRCFTNLLQISLTADFNRRRTRQPIDVSENFIFALNDHPEWYSLMVAASELFGTSNGGISSAFRGNAYAYDFFDDLGSSSLIPTHVRLNKSREPVTLTTLLASSICGKASVPYTWIARIPVTPGMIRPLVVKCWDNIPQLLLFFNECPFSRIGYGAPLLVQQIQRILKVVRHSDNQRLLAGALLALSDSTFLQLAGAELTQRMLGAEIGKVKVGSRLFEPRRVDPHVARSKDIAVINAIATGVLKTPLAFPFKTVSDAAVYVAEHSTINQSPLMSEEANLGIFFQKSLDDQHEGTQVS